MIMVCVSELQSVEPSHQNKTNQSRSIGSGRVKRVSWSPSPLLNCARSPAMPQSRPPLHSLFILYSVSHASTYEFYCQSTLMTSTSTKLITYVILAHVIFPLAEHLHNGTSYESAWSGNSSRVISERLSSSGTRRIHTAIWLLDPSARDCESILLF